MLWINRKYFSKKPQNFMLKVVIEEGWLWVWRALFYSNFERKHKAEDQNWVEFLPKPPKKSPCCLTHHLHLLLLPLADASRLNLLSFRYLLGHAEVSFQQPPRAHPPPPPSLYIFLGATIIDIYAPHSPGGPHGVSAPLNNYKTNRRGIGSPEDKMYIKWSSGDAACVHVLF